MVSLIVDPSYKIPDALLLPLSGAPQYPGAPRGRRGEARAPSCVVCWGVGFIGFRLGMNFYCDSFRH